MIRQNIEHIFNMFFFKIVGVGWNIAAIPIETVQMPITCSRIWWNVHLNMMHYEMPIYFVQSSQALSSFTRWIRTSPGGSRNPFNFQMQNIV